MTLNFNRFLAGILVAILGGHAGAQAPPQAATSAAVAARVPGYLEPAERPDSLLLVPPPPAAGSAALEADLDAYRSSTKLRDTPRWRLAAADANVGFPHAAGIFSCALGLPITESAMPRLYRVLQRSLVDAGQSTLAAKDRYQRERPFTLFDDPICVPSDVEVLRRSGGYPSGHASAGWAWALILTEIAPDRAGPLLRRGFEFGQSRVVCGVHWQSDIDTARTVGAAVYARLQSDVEFRADMAAAREEYARARTAGTSMAPACAEEAAALGPVSR
jgi:acid phosphatase (class A)